MTAKAPSKASLAFAILGELIDDLAMDITLEAHREIKTSHSICHTCQTRCRSFAANPPLYECVNCHRQIASNRYAPHLEKCLGLTARSSSRVAKQKVTTNGDRAAGSPFSYAGDSSGDEGENKKKKRKLVNGSANGNGNGKAKDDSPALKLLQKNKQRKSSPSEGSLPPSLVKSGGTPATSRSSSPSTSSVISSASALTPNKKKNRKNATKTVPGKAAPRPVASSTNDDDGSSTIGDINGTAPSELDMTDLFGDDEADGADGYSGTIVADPPRLIQNDYIDIDGDE